MKFSLVVHFSRDCWSELGGGGLWRLHSPSAAATNAILRFRWTDAGLCCVRAYVCESLSFSLSLSPLALREKAAGEGEGEERAREREREREGEGEG